MKKALFILPHPDDELLVGGGFLYALCNSKEWATYTLFVTNGDYYDYEAEIRIREVEDAWHILGGVEDRIIFLGYGDQWMGGTHLYNTHEILLSHAGKNATYLPNAKNEYHYKKYGVHADYTRTNLKCDIKSVIEDIVPDVIVCVDFDAHPDHRATSLLFEECLGECLKKNPKYKPLVLKKLAYEGIYTGLNDYYEEGDARTQLTNGEIKSSPILKWNDRISLDMPLECWNVPLSHNPLYMAAQVYKSQEIKYIVPRSANADIIYWRRFSENLALQANVSASSGEAQFVNDFKIVDSKNIANKNCRFDASIWHPDKDDSLKKLEMIWDEYIFATEIVFYENAQKTEHIQKLQIVINDNDIRYVTDIKNDGSANRIFFQKKRIKKMMFTIMEARGDSYGITEIEVFNSKRNIEEYDLPCKCNTCVKEKKGNVVLKVGNIICETVYNKVFPSIYYLRRHYPIIKEKKWRLPLVWGDYIWNKIKKKVDESK